MTEDIESTFGALLIGVLVSAMFLSIVWSWKGTIISSVQVAMHLGQIIHGPHLATGCVYLQLKLLSSLLSGHDCRWTKPITLYTTVASYEMQVIAKVWMTKVAEILPRTDVLSPEVLLGQKVSSVQRTSRLS
ncbi:hypothetical protein POSPLADRAFT_1139347 [Postia placenta MAD-698-R-SB12]|uniref:Uncharacterized protein n=1 Tax=Postia placenta MAD-698-R-SB12 TaxID=670580 RepID=A0A1X6N401_9APHY|nr:hypothetical protein POSPLADRAFT_1139347 [Postia placenta MAD-698-R-SB12]OSX63371.1 hypothetical protein POSPLADRAFT_1139347 [Postia placenta MAD-698-R-SB12]